MTKRGDVIEQVVERLGARSFAEIGVLAGELSAELLARCAQLERYYMIDDWLNPADATARIKAVRVAEDPRVRVVERRSVDAARVFADGEIDVAYVDAAHDLESVRQDLDAWWHVARLCLCGHDYVLWNSCAGVPCGVVPAVEEFAVRHDVAVQIDGETMPAYRRLLAAYGVTQFEDIPSWFILK